MTDEQPAVLKKSGFNFASLITEIGIFLANILLPVLIAGGLLLWLASLLNVWKFDRTLASVVFAILLVVVCLFISVMVSGLRKKKVYRSRIVVMLLGGILIPLFVFAAANLLAIAPGETYMARAIQLSISAQPVDVSIAQLGSTVIASKNPFTKVAGIKAISATHSPAALAQLFQVLNQDPAALTDVQVSDVLSKAVAAYGIDAKSELMAVFQKHAQAGEAGSGSQITHLYERYFAGALDSLQSEIKAQPLTDSSKQDQLKQLSALSDQIKATLNEIQSKSLLAGGDPVFNFVLDTFFQMNLAADDSLVSFARAAAANASLPDSARGKALLLLAKLGGKDDLPVLYQYLTSSSEMVKANALDAIASLTLKLNGPAKTK